MSPPVPRVGARLLMLDDRGRILLIHEVVRDGQQTVDQWLTPGGGVEPGETLVEAAVREGYEETGLRVELALDADVVYRQRRLWTWRGVTYDQIDHFFLAHVDSAEPLTHPGLTTMEQATLVGERWWTAEELRASAETFLPPDLADVLDRVAAGRHARA